MKKRKIIKIVAMIILVGVLVAGGIGLYLFNMPHRDVANSEFDYAITASELINEYLADNSLANEKYLADDGESKILKVTGVVSKISTDYNGNVVILLKDAIDKAGVNCSFPASFTGSPKVGSMISVKGVIRSGASYDDDLEMYENVIIEKSTIVDGL